MNIAPIRDIERSYSPPTIVEDPANTSKIRSYRRNLFSPVFHARARSEISIRAVYGVFIASLKRESVASIDRETSRNRFDFERLKKSQGKRGEREREKKGRGARETESAGGLEDRDRCGEHCRNSRRGEQRVFPAYIFIQYNQPLATIFESGTNDLPSPGENGVRVKTSK